MHEARAHLAGNGSTSTYSLSSLNNRLTQVREHRMNFTELKTITARD